MSLVHYRHGMIHKRPGTQWDWYTSTVWYTMGLVRYGHDMVTNRPGTQWDWYTRGMVWYTIGLVHHGTGTQARYRTQRDWYTSMLWYTMGLVHNRPGTQGAGPTVFHPPGPSEGLGSVMKTKAISQPDLVLATCVPMH